MGKIHLTIGRVVAAAVCGTIQLLLVVLGTASLYSHAVVLWPNVRAIPSTPVVVLPLLSLFWPIYVFGAARRLRPPVREANRSN